MCVKVAWGKLGGGGFKKKYLVRLGGGRKDVGDFGDSIEGWIRKLDQVPSGARILLASAIS